MDRSECEPRFFEVLPQQKDGPYDSKTISMCCFIGLTSTPRALLVLGLLLQYHPPDLLVTSVCAKRVVSVLSRKW